MIAPGKEEVALSKALTKANAEVASIVEAMAKAGIGTVGQNIVGKALEPIFQGVVIAHLTNTNADEIEDALANVYLLSLAYYFKRRYLKRADVVKAAQEAINNIASEIGNNIDKDFPATNTVIKAPSGRMDG